ncbi:MAG: HemK2/MTQ2 family protein methyltransferase [Nanoarchaeota archaeon]
MDVYLPAEDSFLLANTLSKYAKSKSVLDMCTGSGILSKIAKESGASSVLAVDINKECGKELKKHSIQFIQSDLFSDIKKNKTFDLIICNPPYLPEDKREDKGSQLATTGGKHGDEFLIRFLKQAPKHLNKKGKILIVISSITPLNRIKSLLKKQNMKLTEIANKPLFMEMLSVYEIKNKQP